MGEVLRTPSEHYSEGAGLVPFSKVLNHQMHICGHFDEPMTHPGGELPLPFVPIVYPPCDLKRAKVVKKMR